MARIEEAALDDRFGWDTPLSRAALARYEQAFSDAGVPEAGVAAALDARGLYR